MKFFRKHKILTGVILVLLLLAIGVTSVIHMVLNKGKIDVVPKEQIDSTAAQVPIAQKEQKEAEVFNVLLIGSDTLDPNAEMGRSDSMMLVSFHQKYETATMVSFLRDSLVEIDGHGKSRLGHAYAYGGVGLTINTINENFDLDIQNYITISFDNLVGIIDEIGGIDIAITAEEAAYYRSCGMPDMEEGVVHLTGSQALTHARNRTIGSDFERTRRQRSVMYGIYNKIIESKDVKDLMPLITYCMTQVETNLSAEEIFKWAKIVLNTANLDVQQGCAPAEGTYQGIVYEGMQVLEIDFEANKKMLKELLY